MTDLDFIAAMQPDIPPITPPNKPYAAQDAQEAVEGICVETGEME